MHYLLLAIGLLLALYALFRFFLKANPHEIKAAFLSVGLIAFALALVFLSVTGRLPAALGLIAALIPFLPRFFRKTREENPAPPPSGTASPAPMTRAEALKILGLGEDADTKAIQSAYKTLMKKLHPDQEGSGWLASKLNEARDFLIGKEERRK